MKRNITSKAPESLEKQIEDLLPETDYSGANRADNDARYIKGLIYEKKGYIDNAVKKYLEIDWEPYPILIDRLSSMKSKGVLFSKETKDNIREWLNEEFKRYNEWGFDSKLIQRGVKIAEIVGEQELVQKWGVIIINRKKKYVNLLLENQKKDPKRKNKLISFEYDELIDFYSLFKIDPYLV